MEPFSLLAKMNLDHIIDLIFHNTGPLTLVHLSQTSSALRRIVTENRIAKRKMQRWRMMIKNPPRMKTFSDSLSDNSMVPCMMVKGDVAMFVELGDDTSINIFHIGQEVVTDRIIVEHDIPLPVYEIDFNEDLITIVAADNEEMWNNLDRKRTVRIYSRQTKFLLKEFRPQDIVRRLILHEQTLFTMSSHDVAVSDLRCPVSPRVKTILVDHRDPVVDMTLGEGALLTLSHSSLYVRKLDTLVSVNKIAFKEKCHKVALSWPLAAVASDEKIEILNIKKTIVLRKLNYPHFLDSLDIRFGCLFASEEGQLTLWSLEDILDGHEDTEDLTHQNIRITDSVAGAMMVSSTKIFAVGWNCQKVLMEFGQ